MNPKYGISIMWAVVAAAGIYRHLGTPRLERSAQVDGYNVTYTERRNGNCYLTQSGIGVKKYFEDNGCDGMVDKFRLETYGSAIETIGNTSRDFDSEFNYLKSEVLKTEAK